MFLLYVDLKYTNASFWCYILKINKNKSVQKTALFFTAYVAMVI